MTDLSYHFLKVINLQYYINERKTLNILIFIESSVINNYHIASLYSLIFF